MLKVHSAYMFGLLKQLRDQGMTPTQLHTMFQEIDVNRLLHALPAWGPFLSADLNTVPVKDDVMVSLIVPVKYSL